MKNIVICCDGTGNEYGKNNTNVVELYSAALNGGDQITYYDPGVGTGGWEYEESIGELRSKSDQATGFGMMNNVMDAYRFLMDEYTPGDRIYLFGFSRGAFTARSLAGMLHKVGLLHHANDNLLEYAAKIYNTADNSEIAAGFMATFAISCPVYFIGVWDTVESLVMNAGKKFYDFTLHPDIKFGYQALSIDEVRRDFPPCLWSPANVTTGQTIEQVWFAGVHADIGGWYDERGLSNITLNWMLSKALACGLVIDQGKADRFSGNPHDKIHQSYSGFWHFRGKIVRNIPDGAMIHQSVIERMQEPANSYQPQNLPEHYTVVD
jgi:uncharacterized protein (DUF2235 family)